jgi:hypothetical protein
LSGGASYGANLNGCVLSANSADGNWESVGGGAFGGNLVNCTLVNNTAPFGGGGGSAASLLTNCILYYNTAAMGANYAAGPEQYFESCCTTPLPTNGLRNFVLPPKFLNLVGGNFRLQFDSACVNAGHNGNASFTTDLDNNPRIAGGTVDIGAYEFQSPSSLLSYAWAQQNGLPTDGSADFTDADGDGMNNYGEWRSDTSPTNSLSFLRMVNATNSPSGKTVTWQSVATRNYWLERATNLGLPSPFQTIATNIVGVAGVKSFTDTSATNAGPYFYRVGVQ